MRLPRLWSAGLALAMWSMPLLGLAQGVTVPVIPGLPGSPTSTVGSAVTDVIIGILLPIAGIIAVLFLIIGGFQYMFAGSDEGLASKGKKTITNAVIGLAIIILSYVIVTIVANTLSRNPAFTP